MSETVKDLVSWKSLGLKENYETGELIILQAPSRDVFPKAPQIFLKSEHLSKSHIRIEPKKGPGSVVFYEFYTSQPGSYSLEAPWGRAHFDVKQREQLGFALEFGIFFIVVSALVMAMAWKFLIKKKP